MKSTIVDRDELMEETDAATNDNNRLIHTCNRLKTMVMNYTAKANATINLEPSPTADYLQVTTSETRVSVHSTERFTEGKESWEESIHKPTGIICAGKQVESTRLNGRFLARRNTWQV